MKFLRGKFSGGTQTRYFLEALGVEVLLKTANHTHESHFGRIGDEGEHSVVGIVVYC